MNIPRDFLGAGEVSPEEQEAIDLFQAGMKKNTALDPDTGKSILKGFLSFAVLAAIGITVLAKRN